MFCKNVTPNVLSTENDYYTNIISLVILLILLGSYQKIRQNTVIIPHKTYIHHIPAFVYLVWFHSQSIPQSDHFQGIIFRPVL